jgi:hypothetical protein
MSMCASGILMSALGLGLILADIYNDRINYITEHAILGGIVSILFFTMCSYGYEIINWILLASVVLLIFFKWLFSETRRATDDDDCDMCKKPKKTCGCPDKEPEPKKFKEPHTCPAKGGMKMGDECGVSRFT